MVIILEVPPPAPTLISEGLPVRRPMYFVTLAKSRGKITKDVVEWIDKTVRGARNVKLLNGWWTLGRYDAVWVTEAPDEKSVIELFLKFGDHFATETLVGIEAIPTAALEK